MKRGYLSEYFEGVAGKRLSAVEAEETRSHQHEYNAIQALLDLLGRPSEKQQLPTRYVYLNDESDEVIYEDAFLTLYDARAAHPIRSEYRLYFPTTQVSQLATEGDYLLIAKPRTGPLLVIIAEGGSSIAAQLQWLFGLDRSGELRFSVRSELETEQDRVGFASSFILESIGIEVKSTEESELDLMLSSFGTKFPTSAEFSDFTRSRLLLDSRDGPDGVLVSWIEKEEILFRTFERYLVGERLQQGFSAEKVDEFISFSLSVQNRRKSRMGHSFENHVEYIFNALDIKHKRGAYTEGKSKPDFLFPDQVSYRDASFPSYSLRMLAVKSTCKDRWRQVLAEAKRIERKHLLTLEAPISTGQTDEMRESNLQLVVPRGLQEAYRPEQQAWLMDFAGFIEEVSAT